MIKPKEVRVANRGLLKAGQVAAEVSKKLGRKFSLYDNMTRQTKLELTWIGKENRPKLEPRILVEDPAKFYHTPFRTGKNDIFDNRLILGDNILALKALEQ